MGKLDGQTCVITGGGGAVGRASALKFLSEGARVLVADVNEKACDETVSLAADQGYGDAVALVHVDVGSEQSVEEMCAAAVRRFGSMDAMFLCAGIIGAFGAIEHTWLVDWEATLRVLLTGGFLCMREAARVMRQQERGGSIVSMTSVAASAAGFAPAAYSAAKAGLTNLTRIAAVEFAPLRIRVNSIAAGAIFTPMIHRSYTRSMEEEVLDSQPWPDRGAPEDIAEIAAFLASKESRFITGATIVADGGLTARGAGGVYSTIAESTAGRWIGMDFGSTGEPILLRGHT